MSPAAAAPDEVEAILLVAQSVMEKRPKRSGRGPEKHDGGPILLGRRGQWILSPNTNLSRPRIPSPQPASEFSQEGESRGVTLKSPFLLLTNGLRSRRGTFSFRLPHRGTHEESSRCRRERHFSARLLFLVGGDICLDGGVQSSRGRAKSPLLRHSLHPPYYLAIFFSECPTILLK